MRKRFISLCAAFALCLTLLPISALSVGVEEDFDSLSSPGAGTKYAVTPDAPEQEDTAVLQASAIAAFYPTSASVEAGKSGTILCIYQGSMNYVASMLLISRNESVARVVASMDTRTPIAAGGFSVQATVTGVSPGTAELVFAVGDANENVIAYTTMSVTVTNPSCSLSFSPSSVSVDTGTSTDVTCVFTGDTANADSYFYGVMSSDESIAVPQQKNIVKGNGQVTFTTTVEGVAEGSATITVAVFDASYKTIVQNTFPVTVTKPAAPSVKTVSRNGNTVTAEIVCTDTNATVFCGAYNTGGKMIAFRSAQVTGETTYNLQFDGQEFDYAKVFIVDSNFRPLCMG